MYHRITQDGKVLTAARKFTALSISLIAMIFLLRFYEIFSTSLSSTFPPGVWKNELSGLRFDLAIAVKLLSYLMIPYLLIAFFSLIASKYFFMACNMLLAFASISLVQYFSKSMVPLGADLWGYSINEMKQTIGSSGALSFKSILPFLTFGGFAVWFSILLFKIEIKRTYSFLFCLFLFINLFLDLPLKPATRKTKTEFERYAQNNKLGFFIFNNLDYFEKRRLMKKEFKDTEAEQSGRLNDGSSSSKVLDKEYPFMHKDVTPDVLSQFFKLGKKAPNFVFLVVESLGRSYAGKDAELGSFTPFLETLMDKSLYWENALSTSGRTFSVMPSLFGSLPFAENGFAEMGKNMPNQISLISILMKNGYQSAFYYGSDSKFDNMALFFKNQGMRNFKDQPTFDHSYKRLPAMKNGFTWGYGDAELFRKYLSDSKVNVQQPKIDVLLTINMHDPFIMNEQAVYDAKFVEHLKKLNISEEKKKYDAQYSAQLATVLCFDDALKYFFQEYAKREDFNNTIFIITGDHRMPEIPISSQLNRFHVPIVIYSPMLKKAQKFSSISTHLDVAPSILAMLRTRFKLKLPSTVAWIGTGLDVNTEFRNIHSYPLMRNKSELLDYIDKENFISNGTLYKIFPNNGIDQIQDAKRLKEIQDKFEVYKKNNWYVCKMNKILPDSIITKY